MSHATISRTGQAGQTGAVGLDTSQEVRRVRYDGDGGTALTVARSLGRGDTTRATRGRSGTARGPDRWRVRQRRRSTGSHER